MRTRLTVGWLAGALLGFGATTIAVAPAADALECADLLAIGHRGYGKGRNENTVPHMRRAVAHGAQVVEFDVRRTRDGVLAIMHDRTVNRTTNGRGRVSRMRWHKLRSLRTPAGFHPPSLGQVARSMGDLGVGLQVHLKVGLTARRLRGVGAMLRRNGFTEETVQFNSDKLSLLRRANRATGFPTGYTYLGRPRSDRLNRVAAYGVDVAVLQRDYVKPAWVSYAAERGVELAARSHAISKDWALTMGVRRLVVDRWSWTCDPVEPPPEPDPDPTDRPTPRATVRPLATPRWSSSELAHPSVVEQRACERPSRPLSTYMGLDRLDHQDPAFSRARPRRARPRRARSRRRSARCRPHRCSRLAALR